MSRHITHFRRSFACTALAACGSDDGNAGPTAGAPAPTPSPSPTPSPTPPRHRPLHPAAGDALFLAPPGTGKSHLAQAIGRAAIQQGYRVTYREAHTLLEEVAEAAVDGTRKALLTDLATVPLLIIDDLGVR